MSAFLEPAAWLGALAIFALRVSDMSLDTIRVLFVMRGRKLLAWVLGFFQSIIFVVAISSVLTHLGNPLNVIGYAAGFATGNVVGMIIEEKLAIGHVKINIVSSRRVHAVMEALRAGGFAVTEIPARGKDGSVGLLNVSVLRRDIDRVEMIVRGADTDAFITTEDVRPLRRGFWRA
ncbi:MAG: DUF5698 domain-containing protein [Anaerolineaceae bacterium]|nr:DUF5698 domain-containing protein [Anaerolineaceae bacterium]